MLFLITVVACIILAALQVADVILTNKILKNPQGVELNPLMKFAQKILGDKWWLTKLIFIPAIYIIIINADNIYYQSVWILNAIYGYIVYNNYTVSKRV